VVYVVVVPQVDVVLVMDQDRLFAQLTDRLKVWLASTAIPDSTDRKLTFAFPS